MLANEMRESLKKEFSLIPGEKILSLVYVGENPVIQNFIRYKKKFGDSLGIELRVHQLAEESSEKEILQNIENIISKKESSAIVVQLPLPSYIDKKKILDVIPEHMDIDVLGEDAKKSFKKGKLSFFPPVVGAILKVLESQKYSLQGKNICLLGYGKLVGEPMAIYLERENIPFTLLRQHHSQEEKEKALMNADMIISGIVKAHYIKASSLKDGVVLIDAGTSEEGGKLVGDIDPNTYGKALFYTPVPGGIGPLTIAILYENFLKAVKG